MKCIIVFIGASLGKVKIPATIKVNLLEMSMTAILMGVVAFFLILHE